jgi:hypothetical protein
MPAELTQGLSLREAIESCSDPQLVNAAKTVPISPNATMPGGPRVFRYVEELRDPGPTRCRSTQSAGGQAAAQRLLFDQFRKLFLNGNLHMIGVQTHPVRTATK